MKIAVLLMMLALLLAAIDFHTWKWILPASSDLGSLGRWMFVLNPSGVVVSRGKQELFTIYPGMVALLPASVAGAILLKDDIRLRRLRTRGFAVRYPRWKRHG